MVHRHAIYYFVFFIFSIHFAYGATFQPELILQQGHTRSIVAVAISPDHRWLASGSQDSTVKIWDLSSGMLLRTLYGHTGKINAIAINHDGQWIASAGQDKKVRLWGISTGNSAYVLSGFQTAATSLAFTSDNKSLIAASPDVVRIFDCAAGREVGSMAFKEEDRGGRTLISPDGRLVVIGGATGKSQGDPFRPMKIIEISSHRELSKIKVDVLTPFASVAFSSRGELLAVRGTENDRGDNHEFVKIFDSNSGKEKTTLHIPGEANAQSTGAITFSSDSNLLAVETALQENLSAPVLVFDVQSGRAIRELKATQFFVPVMNFDVVSMISTPLAFSPDSQLLALGGSSSVQLWETKTGKALQALRTNLKAGAFSGNMDPRMEEALQQSGINEELATEMRMESGNILDQMTDPDSPMSEAMNWAKQFASNMGVKGNSAIFDKKVFFTGNGKWLITQIDKEVRIWDMGSGTYLPLPLGTTAPVAVSNDGRFIAEMEMDQNIKAAQNGSQQLVIRDAATFTIRSKIAVENPEGLSFTADGNSLAILIHNNGELQVQIVDPASGKLTRAYSVSSGGIFSKAGFSPNGRLLAVGGAEKTAAVPTIPTVMPGMSMSKKDMKKMMEQMSKMMKTMQGQAENKDAANYEVKLLDVQSGQVIKSFSVAGMRYEMVHNSNLQVSMPGATQEAAMTFSADGSLIGLQDSEGQAPVIKVFEVASGKLITTVPANAKPLFAFSSDRKTLALTSQEGQYAVNLISLSKNEATRVLQQPGRVDSLSFSPDGRFLVSMMQDRTRVIWSAATGEKLATLVEFPGYNFTTEWLVTTPQGLFDGSPGAFNQILWRFSPNTFDVAPVEAFFNELYYPGLLSEISSGRAPRPARDISQIDRGQPKVQISSEARAENTTEAKIIIDVEDAGTGARDLRLFRNGLLVKVWHDAVLQNGQKKTRLEFTLPLIAGENRFLAYAFSDSNIKSADSTIMVRGGENLRHPGVAHILAAGINQYSNPDFSLKFAVPDAQTFAETLEQSIAKTGKFQKVETTLLLDGDATKEKILEAFAKLKDVHPEDSVFVYFAGHGTADGSRFYMVPQQIAYSGSRDNLDANGMKMILEQSISDLDLQKAFEEIDAASIVFVIDACNSGQALESPEKRFGLMNSKGLAQLAYEKGMYILAAAQSYQAALEAAELGHGYLTYALVEEALKTASADTAPQDGNVAVREWLDYSTNRVPQMQMAQLQNSRLLKHEESNGGAALEQYAVQRPRVFYRREADLQPLIVATP